MFFTFLHISYQRRFIFGRYPNFICFKNHESHIRPHKASLCSIPVRFRVSLTSCLACCGSTGVFLKLSSTKDPWMIMVIVRLFRSVTVLCLHRRMGDRGTSKGDSRMGDTLFSKATGTSKTNIVPKVFTFGYPDWFCLKAHDLPFTHPKFYSSGSSSLAST